MSSLVLDSYALLAYFEKETGWDEVAEYLSTAANDEVELLLSVVNWGEVDYVIQRVYDRSTADEVLAVIDDLPINVRDVSRADARAAARFKARGGLSYADCFAAGLAHQIDGPVVTGDPEFEQVEGEIAVRWLE
jgi:ribonuclease VapC